MTDIYTRLRKLEADMTEELNLSVKRYLSHRESAIKNMCEPDVKPELGTPQHILPPNPGSDLAQAMGCTCPVIDNHHGLGRRARSDFIESGSFITVPGCPVHAPEQAGLWDAVDAAVDARRTGEEG
jgi:hypothetical protein